MDISRRDFLKGILTTTTAVALVGPAALEPVHGAHDLTPTERDAVADIFGWRSKFWQINNPWSALDGYIQTGIRDSLLMVDNVGLVVPVANAYQRYAERIGVPVIGLDEAQKRQAFIEELLRVGDHVTVDTIHVQFVRSETVWQYGARGTADMSGSPFVKLE